MNGLLAMVLLVTGGTGTYWVWGQAVPFGGNEGGTIGQAFVCKSDNRGYSIDYVARDCLMIGPPTDDAEACHGEQMRQAAEDFPEHIVRFCVPIRLKDLERLVIPSK